MEDFQFQILPIPEAVSLSNQPSNLVIETFRRGIGQMVKSPRVFKNKFRNKVEKKRENSYIIRNWVSVLPTLKNGLLLRV